MLETLLRLSYCRGLGPCRAQKLLSLFSDPKEIFTLSDEELTARTGIHEKQLPQLKDPALLRAARNEIRASRKRSITLTALTDPAYPRSLKEIPDPPLVVRVRGELPPEPGPAIAVVGTRKASAYGRRQTIHLVRELARRGITIISGLARGIDGIAHEEAIKAGGKTFAVLGSGLGRIYPPEHRALADLIARNGALISEFSLFSPPTAFHFPQRNRIISGLSLGVLVIEGGKKSGTMITAGCAADQGRTVFAVPGNSDSPLSEGTNQLIREGAVLTTKPEDIIEELLLSHCMEKSPAGDEERGALPITQLTAAEQDVYQAMEKGPVDAHAVCRRLGLSMSTVMATLTSLEIKHVLRRFGDGLEKL